MSNLSLALDTPSLASHYERVSRDRQFKAGQALVEKLGIGPGQHVLDVGSGTGLLAEHVANVVGEAGSVVGVDPLPLRIDIARRKERHNLHFSVGDAYDLAAFDAETFDVVYLNAVFHWLPEKTAPLRQFYRVLKPGGQLGISTGSKDHVSPLQRIRRAVLAREPYRAYPQSSAGFAHRVGQEELESLLRQAGFGRVSVDVLPHVQLQPTPAAAIEFAQASSFGNFSSHLPDDLARRAAAEIEIELAQLATPDGLRLESGRLVAIATKPAAA